MSWWDELKAANKAQVETANIRYVEYPQGAAGIGAAQVQATDKNDGGATPWAWGADKEIVAKDAINTDFWLCAVEIGAGDAAADTMVRIGTGETPTWVVALRVYPKDDTGWILPIWLPYPIKTALKSAIDGGIATKASSGKVLSLSVIVGTDVGT